MSRIIKSPTLSGDVYHVCTDSSRDRPGRAGTDATGEGQEEQEAARRKALEEAAVEAGRRKAGQLLEQAKRDKARLVAEAQKEAETIRAEALEEGRAAGHREGREQGLEEGRKQGREEYRDRIENFKRQAEQLIESMQNEKGRLIRKHERNLVNLACEIAGRIVRKKIEDDQEIIQRVVEAALERATKKERLVIRLNPKDHEWLHAHADNLKQMHEEIKELLLESDGRVEAGGCVIETMSGNVDARIERQMEEMRRGLEEDR